MAYRLRRACSAEAGGGGGDAGVVGLRPAHVRRRRARAAGRPQPDDEKRPEAAGLPAAGRLPRVSATSSGGGLCPYRRAGKAAFAGHVGRSAAEVYGRLLLASLKDASILPISPKPASVSLAIRKAILPLAGWAATAGKAGVGVGARRRVVRGAGGRTACPR